MDIIVGSVVKSRAGHDKERFFITLGSDNGFALIADGKERKLEKPKRKNIKHLAPTGSVYDLPETNKQLRKLLKDFSNQED